jgi:hypothetical protein
MPPLLIALSLTAVAVGGCITSLAPASALCRARPGAVTITLTDGVPKPAVTVTVGSPVVVIEPRWGWGKATEVNVSPARILSQNCTVQLRGGGRRTIFQAVKPGSSYLGATVEPASNLAAPAWGGNVVVLAR